MHPHLPLKNLYPRVPSSLIRSAITRTHSSHAKESDTEIAAARHSAPAGEEHEAAARRALEFRGRSEKYRAAAAAGTVHPGKKRSNSVDHVFCSLRSGKSRQPSQKSKCFRPQALRPNVALCSVCSRRLQPAVVITPHHVPHGPLLRSEEDRAAAAARGKGDSLLRSCAISTPIACRRNNRLPRKKATRRQLARPTRWPFTFSSLHELCSTSSDAASTSLLLRPLPIHCRPSPVCALISSSSLCAIVRVYA